MISLTIFVGIEMGLSFSQKSWGENALLAIGQATSGFAMILGMLQFKVRCVQINFQFNLYA